MFAVALAAAAGAAHAQHAVLVRQDPAPDGSGAATTPAPRGGTPQARFTSVMDSVFGAGRWRQTGGYRTPEREDELRALGAGTVRPGAISAHSLGRPGAPGAYDAVVEGLGVQAAAQRLRESGAPFSRILAEGAHGGQGAHLHLEPISLGLSRVPSLAAHPAWTVADVTPAQLALARLRGAAQGGDATSQLRLGAAYAEGKVAPRDFVAAYVWTAAAGANPAADAALKRDSDQVLLLLAQHMKPDEMAAARRFAQPRPCRTAAALEEASPVVLVLAAPAGASPSAPAACPAGIAASAASPAS